MSHNLWISLNELSGHRTDQNGQVDRSDGKLDFLLWPRWSSMSWIRLIISSDIVTNNNISNWDQVKISVKSIRSFLHFILYSGHTVYFGLTLEEGKEVCVRKLKTKQLPQLKPNMIKNMLALRHPNLLKYEQFCILKVRIIYRFTAEKLIYES